MGLVFLAYGYLDVDLVCRMIAHTARFPPDTIRTMLYSTLQHTATVRTREEALTILGSYMQPPPGGRSAPWRTCCTRTYCRTSPTPPRR